MWTVRRWCLICLSLFCISSSVVGESRKESPSTLCLYIYIVSLKNHSVTRLCQFYVCVYSKKRHGFQSSLHLLPGVALIAKLCVNIAFSGAVRILATSLRHRTQNDWTPIQQVTAHWWLPRHSTLDLFSCKLRVISTVAPHSSPALKIQSMKGGIWTTK